MAVWKITVRFSMTLFLLDFCPTLQAADRPNVVFILADDLGWSDTTLYGTTKLYQTSNIERLASRGMTFSRAYAASPLCSPTRSSILTGLSPARTGITTPNCHLPQVVLQATPGVKGAANVKAAPVNSVSRLNTDYYTLAKALRDAGYATGHFGKWHLGHEPYSPLEHGFDTDIPHWSGPGPAGSYVAPWKFPDFDPDIPNEHIEDRMAKEAVSFIESHKDKQFFLNYWMFSVHAPFDGKQALIEKYRAKTAPEAVQRSPTYAAMIESMDDAVGTLLDTLDRLGIAQDTIIVFASDNGGNMYNEVDGTTPTSNHPLRGGKATMYEGGVRGPCSIVWPGTVPGGSRSNEIIQSCDFYPTLLEILNIEPQPGQQFDGVSIVPALMNERLKRDGIFTYFPHAARVPDWLPPAVSVHRGEWKLIRIFHGGNDGAHRWKLYNLKNDINEHNDLARTEPERVKELDALIERFLVETDAVVPVPNPDFDPSTYRPEDEGKSQRGSPNKRKAPRVPPVAGWRRGNDCELSVKDGALVIDSDGRDPHLSFRLPKPLPATKLKLHITLSSTASGRGQVFWQEQGVNPAFIRDRSTVFDIKHDGESHDYVVTLNPQHPVLSIRLDPAQSRGKIRVAAMSLTDDDDRRQFSWSFRKTSAKHP
ncbi:MAG: sulfatase [Fuerstiella sp.]|nr:sulfatase [Fuerstiella sp.]